MTSETRDHRLLLLLLTLTPVGCADAGDSFQIGAYRYHTERFQQWALPKALGEISGLTLDPQGRLFAHDDERARIYQLDYVEGRVVKRFDLGDPPLRGDFEGIAWANDELFLVTSDGTLFAAREGEDGTAVPFERYDTGLGERCEIEGLHYDHRHEVLRMPCKTVHDPALAGRIVVLTWSPREQRPDPARDVLVAGLDRQFQPSGLTQCPGSGHLVLVAARQRALIEVDGVGALRRLVALPHAARHRQMEGVEMTPQGDLIIADEGRERGRLGVYTAQQ